MKRLDQEKRFRKLKQITHSMKGLVKGYEAQVKNDGIALEKVQQSEIYDQVPVYMSD